MTVHFPVLVVVVPLLAAPLAVVLRRAGWIQVLFAAVAGSQLAMSLHVVHRVLREGVISYHLGGWVPPWGIEYRIDAANGLLLLLLSMMACIVLPYTFTCTTREVPAERRHYFYALVLLSMTGLTGMTVTGDAFNVFVFLEIAALSTYGLIAMGRDPKALTASFRYLLMGTTGGTFFLIGLGMILMATGTLNMVDISQRLAAGVPNRTVVSALAFITVGLGLKMAAFPMHIWLPNTYTYAPIAVTVLLAATATKVAVYVFCRFVYSVFGGTLAFDQIGIGNILLPAALAGIFVGSIAATYKLKVRRILAFSSVAQLGYMLLGISLNNIDALTGTLVHTFNHGIMKAALFMSVGAFAAQLDDGSARRMAGATNIRLDDLNGIGRRMPWTAAAFTICGLSLIGVPLTVGFVSKWYLILGALSAQNYVVVAAILAGSLLAGVYMWKMVERIYFAEPSPALANVTEASAAMLIPMWILTGLSIAFGISTSTTAGIARIAAAQLLGVTP